MPAAIPLKRSAPEAELENPLNKPVAIITENREFITSDHVGQLMNAFPENMLKKYMPAADGSVSRAENTLGRQLERMMRVQEQLMNSALMSDDPELKKKAMTSGKDLFNLFAKFEKLVDRQTRQSMIEGAVKESFAELNDDKLQARFLDILKNKLQDAAKNK